MKRFIFILVSAIAINAYAITDAPFASGQASEPAIAMQSVNHADYMSSGSSYRSPVFDIGASGPAAAPAVRKAPPGKDGTGYDPTNPQFGPIGDATVVWLIMALVYAIVLYRTQKAKRKAAP